jgi:hypothetical protein
MEKSAINAPVRVPWNKGKFAGQKPPLKPWEIWAIRIRLQLSARRRDLAIFNLAIDSKLRACDLTKLRVRDVCHGQQFLITVRRRWWIQRAKPAEHNEMEQIKLVAEFATPA